MSRKSISSFDDCGSTSEGESSVNSRSSFDLVSVAALAAADTVTSQGDESVEVTRGAETSCLMARDYGVPNFLRTWWQRDGAATGDGALPAVELAEAPQQQPCATAESVTDDARTSDGSETDWYREGADRATTYLKRASLSCTPVELSSMTTNTQQAVELGTATATSATPEPQEHLPIRLSNAEDEEWSLEGLLRRKAGMVDVNSEEDVGDYDDEEAYVKSGSAAGMRAGTGRQRRTWLYLCKWRGYADPTWESRELLINEGYRREVDAFDAVKVGAEPAPSVRARRWGNRLRESVMPDPSGSAIDFDQLFPDAAGYIQAMFRNSEWKQPGTHVHRIARVDSSEANRRFAATWEHLSRVAGVVPVIVFHGARRVNVPSIIRRGLQVAGNGSLAIYTTKWADTSAAYSDVRAGDASGSKLIFACVGLISRRCRVWEELVLFTSAAAVMPVWLVECSNERDELPPRLVSLDQLADREASRYDALERSKARAKADKIRARHGTDYNPHLPDGTNKVVRTGGIHGNATVGGVKVPTHAVDHGVKGSSVKGERKEIKELVRSGDLHLVRRRDRTRGRKPTFSRDDK
jgi:hypothetical protein